MGKIVVIGLLAVAAAAGFGIYYANNAAYWSEMENVTITATPVGGGAPEPLGADEVNAIRSASSPLGFRACFTTSTSPAMLSETYVLLEDAAPTVPPSWFECFDAPAIGAALDSGEALAFMGQENIAYGVNRVFAVYADGRGFAWHELNNCGRKAYDGTPVGDACPDPATFEGDF